MADKDGRKDIQDPENNVVLDDPISFIIGEHGLWQYKIMFFLSFISFPCMSHLYSPTFINARIDFWCLPPDHLSEMPLDLWKNISQPNGPCFIRHLNWENHTILSSLTEDLQNQPCTNLTKCTRWGYDRSIFTETITSEWDLVCEKDSLSVMIDSMFLLGAALGGVCSGFVSDRLGRKTTLMVALLIQVATGLSVSFSPNIEIYVMCRVVLGFVCVSVLYCAFILSVEVVGGNWVVIAGVVSLILVPFTCMLSSVISMYVPHWRHFQLAISLIGSPILLLWWGVPESPRWLSKVGCIGHLEQELRKACSVNKRALPPNFDELLLKMKEAEVVTIDCLDLFRPPIRYKTFHLCVIWFSLMMIYFGLVLNVEDFGGNLHITSILVSIVEVPAMLISIPVLIKIGRKYPISLSYFVSGVACIITLAIQETSDDYWTPLVFVLIAKFFAGACNVSLPIYTAELYPTLLRNFGIGVTQVAGGIALFLSPFVFSITPPVPLSILGAFGIIAGLSTLCLPETKMK